MNTIRSLEQATSYWLHRQESRNAEPFLLYVFQRGEQAIAALVELSSIIAHADRPDQLSAGCYPAADGKHEALLCGSRLNHYLWQQARCFFIQHGGSPKCEQEPEAITEDYFARLNRLTALQLGW